MNKAVLSWRTVAVAQFVKPQLHFHFLRKLAGEFPVITACTAQQSALTEILSDITNTVELSSE